ncbi:hypothetical protein Gotur_005727 [Gossypium turneri]
MESGLHIATPILNVAKTDNIQNMETALDVSTPIRDESDIDKYLQQLQPYTFIQKQGFDPLIRN